MSIYFMQPSNWAGKSQMLKMYINSPKTQQLIFIKKDQLFKSKTKMEKMVSILLTCIKKNGNRVSSSKLRTNGAYQQPSHYDHSPWCLEHFIAHDRCGTWGRGLRLSRIKKPDVWDK